MTIDHLCGGPNCVNPEQLEALTQGENTRRGENDGDEERCEDPLLPRSSLRPGEHDQVPRSPWLDDSAVPDLHL